MKYIGFFLSAQETKDKYKVPALELVHNIVQAGYGFVYGGSERGLMKDTADEVSKNNGKIIAVTCEEFKAVVTQDADETICASNIAERKLIILQKSDAIIALPGGTGTLDEITDIIEGRKLRLHDKPIILFNIDGFWNGLICQFKKMYDDGFLPREVDELFWVNDNPSATISYLQKELTKH